MLLVATSLKGRQGKCVFGLNCGGPQATLHSFSLLILWGLSGALGPVLSLPTWFSWGGHLETEDLPSSSLQESEDQSLAKAPTIQLLVSASRRQLAP